LQKFCYRVLFWDYGFQPTNWLWDLLKIPKIDPNPYLDDAGHVGRTLMSLFNPDLQMWGLQQQRTLTLCLYEPHKLLATLLGCKECQPRHCSKTVLPIVLKNCQDSEGFLVEEVGYFQNIIKAIQRIFEAMAAKNSQQSGSVRSRNCDDQSGLFDRAKGPCQGRSECVWVYMATVTLLGLVTTEGFLLNLPEQNDQARGFLTGWHQAHKIW